MSRVIEPSLWPGTAPKPNPKPKLNLTIREESRKKLERLAELENRSVSNLIEIMADERWDRLAETEGFPFVKIITDIADQVKLNIGSPSELRRFRKAIIDQFLKTKPTGQGASAGAGKVGRESTPSSPHLSPPC